MRDAEKNKQACREWYKKNREYHIANVQKRQKKLKYEYEKRKEIKKRVNIKSLTRKKYPLLGKICISCSKPATEHHHYTHPIKVDRFHYMCHEHHMRADLELNNHAKRR